MLTINGGSSSIRFAVYEMAANPRLHVAGKIDRIGGRGARLIVEAPAPKSQALSRGAAAGHVAAVNFLLAWLERQPIFASITAVGHRVVHGMTHSKPETITRRLLAELRRITPYDPEHLPREIALIEA
ncbi:MAG: acetate kinase, partial [Verrucomicrobia bacterium]|nr:acetate kinase [Verrucomicrobiota bacterium]